MQDQQAVNRVIREHCSSFFHYRRGVTVSIAPHPHGITVNVVPIIAVSPRLPRYSRRPHYRADL